VRLVRPDDPDYLAAMREQALRHRRPGPRQEPGPIHRASSRAELAVRRWLGERVPLLEERVIAARVEADGAEVIRYLELDAVEALDGVPRRLFEIKFTSSGRTVRRGVGQLARARELLETVVPPLESVIVLVDANRRGVALDERRAEALEVLEVADLRDVRPGRLSVLRIDHALLREHLSADDRALIEEARDEGETLTAARRPRWSEDGTGRFPRSAGAATDEPSDEDPG
jgi:hypothetical protein